MAKKKESSGSKLLSVSLAMLTIVVAGIVAIPGFVRLNRDRPVVFYTTDQISVLNERSPNYEELINVLQANRIPDSRLIVSMVNTGDVEAKEVRIGVEIDGKIADILPMRSEKYNPVWVGLLDANEMEVFKGKPIANIPLKRFTSGKRLNIEIGYFSFRSPQRPAIVDVFFDGRDFAGKEATLVSDLSTVHQESFFSIFRVPMIILVSGIGITLLVSVAVVLSKNRELAGLLYSTIKEIGGLYLGR